MNKITSLKDCNPGHLYCAVVTRWDGERDYDSHEGLYWYSSDGELYARGGFLSDDDEEPAFPEWDYLVEQAGAFDAFYVTVAA